MVYPSSCVMEKVHETHQTTGKCCTQYYVLKTINYMSFQNYPGSMYRLFFKEMAAWLVKFDI